MIRRHCIVCGGYYVVKKNKTLRIHTRALGSGGSFRIERCPGSGQEGTVNHRD